MPRTLQRGRHGGRSGPFRRLLRGAVKLGGGAIDWLFCPARLLRRALSFLRSKKARRDSAAAAMARRDWRDGPQPAVDPLLRRAVAHAGGAIDAMLRRGRRALAVIRNLPHRARAIGRDFLQRVLRLIREFPRRLLRRRQPCLPQRAETPSPPPSPPSPPKRCAWYYPRPPPRPARFISPPPPPAPPARPAVFVGGEQVPDWVIDLYVQYCTRPCPPTATICHLCSFEGQHWSNNCTVTTGDMIRHCGQKHRSDGPYVRCDEPGCSVRVRPGLDQERHVHFCHRSPADWWEVYVRQPEPCDQ